MDHQGQPTIQGKLQLRPEDSLLYIAVTLVLVRVIEANLSEGDHAGMVKGMDEVIFNVVTVLAGHVWMASKRTPDTILRQEAAPHVAQLEGLRVAEVGHAALVAVREGVPVLEAELGVRSGVAHSAEYEVQVAMRVHEPHLWWNRIRPPFGQQRNDGRCRQRHLRGMRGSRTGRPTTEPPSHALSARWCGRLRGTGQTLRSEHNLRRVFLLVAEHVQGLPIFVTTLILLQTVHPVSAWTTPLQATSEDVWLSTRQLCEAITSIWAGTASFD